jgi:two-component system sensor histidine kinase and response regulator WspE
LAPAVCRFSDPAKIPSTRAFKSLEKLQQDALISPSLNQDGKALLETARRKEQECRDLLSDRLTELEGFVRRTANLSDRLYREVITSNMRPFADGVQSFPG